MSQGDPIKRAATETQMTDRAQLLNDYGVVGIIYRGVAMHFGCNTPEETSMAGFFMRADHPKAKGDCERCGERFLSK